MREREKGGRERVTESVRRERKSVTEIERKRERERKGRRESKD